jgi:hypothetical protein
MNSYHTEQLETLRVVRDYLHKIAPAEKQVLHEKIGEYLEFRRDVGDFLNQNFTSTCNRKCFESRLSACCSREGIITFFADVVVNALLAGEDGLQRLEEVLAVPNTGFKCVYLGPGGCLWKVKPIVCEMFLCDSAKEKVFKGRPSLESRWEEYLKKEKRFKWPDRPVLFDEIEQIFMDAGYRSPLMYLHNSPGLLRVKEVAKKQLG